jgi:hypothetical protein
MMKIVLLTRQILGGFEPSSFVENPNIPNFTIPNSVSPLVFPAASSTNGPTCQNAFS